MKLKYTLLSLLLCSAAWGQYDPTSDPNLIAWWKLDNGALTTDSESSNTLTNNNTVTNDTGDKKEGDASGDFELDSSQYMSIVDSNLSASFPGKNGVSFDAMSISFWYKPETTGAAEALISKYTDAQNSYLLQLLSGVPTLWTNASSTYAHASTLSTGTWYWINIQGTVATKAYTIAVRNADGTPLGVDKSGTASGAFFAASTSAFRIGPYESSSTLYNYPDGKFDDMQVRDRILSVTEMREIVLQTYPFIDAYNPSQDPNCIMWYRLEEFNNAVDTTGNQADTVHDLSLEYTTIKEGAVSVHGTTTTRAAIAAATLHADHPLKNSPATGAVGDFTFMAWLNRDNLTGAVNLTGTHVDQGSRQGFEVGTADANGAMFWTYGYSSSNSHGIGYHASSLVATQWYHVALTYNATTFGWTLDVWDDNAGATLGTKATGTCAGAATTNDQPLHINGSPIFTNNGITGYMDDYIWYKRILTDAEVQAHIDQDYLGPIADSTTVKSMKHIGRGIGHGIGVGL